MSKINGLFIAGGGPSPRDRGHVPLKGGIFLTPFLKPKKKYFKMYIIFLELPTIMLRFMTVKIRQRLNNVGREPKLSNQIFMEKIK